MDTSLGQDNTIVLQGAGPEGITIAVMASAVNSSFWLEVLHICHERAGDQMNVHATESTGSSVVMEAIRRRWGADASQSFGYTGAKLWVSPHASVVILHSCRHPAVDACTSEPLLLLHRACCCSAAAAHLESCATLCGCSMRRRVQCSRSIGKVTGSPLAGIMKPAGANFTKANPLDCGMVKVWLASTDSEANQTHESWACCPA